MGMKEQLKTGGQKSKEKYANHCKRGNKNKSSFSYLTPLHCFIKEYSCDGKTREKEVNFTNVCFHCLSEIQTRLI